jgi:opacity protein-like surface antigen
MHMNLKIVAAITALLAVQGSSAALAQPVTETASVTANASSWVLGGQAGYNWQQGAWVYGLAADISAMNLSSQANAILPGFLLCRPPLTLTSTGMALSAAFSVGRQVRCCSTALVGWLMAGSI